MAKHSMIIPIEHHDHLGHCLNEMGLLGAGAEIGVAMGLLSKLVLSSWKGNIYYMVDIWAKQDSAIYREQQTCGVHDPDYEQWYQDCVAIANHDPRVRIIRKLSEEAVKDFQDGELDWVYIDANHAFPEVTKDLVNWWPKVRSGGLFGGHDYCNRYTNGDFIEVKQAVDQWVISHNREIIVTPACGSWWTIKP